MSGRWDELKGVLETLAADPGRPLRSFPMPSVDDGRVPPYRIALDAWALQAAAMLHARFGADVELRVGHLGFPGATRPETGGAALGNPTTSAPLIDPSVLSVELPSEVVVVSGHDVHTTLRVHNHATAPIVLATNGQVTARLLDGRNGRPIACSSSPQTLALVTIRVEPARASDVRLLVGTASLDPSYGYALRAGRWWMDAVLDLGGGRRVRTPALAVTVLPATPAGSAVREASR